MPTTIKKKLSVMEVHGRVPSTIPNGERIPIMDIYGVAMDTKSGETDKGPWISLLGTFHAAKLDSNGDVDGNTYRAGQAFLPDVALGLVLPQLQQDDVGSVEFGFRIYAKGDDTSVTRYVYECESMIPIEENDPLEALIAKIEANKTKKIEKKPKTV